MLGVSESFVAAVGRAAVIMSFSAAARSSCGDFHGECFSRKFEVGGLVRREMSVS